MRRVRGEFFILLSVLTLILVGPVWGGGMPDSGQGIYTDYGSFLGEYQTAGALKFYDNTEEMLRLAQFETALMRYRFLKGKIQRRVDYRGLLEMVDYRLRFLKKQLHLTNRDIAAIPPRRAWIPRQKPPAPKPAAKKDAAAKPKPPAAPAADKNKQKGALTIPGQIPPVYLTPRPSATVGTPPGMAVPPKTAVPGATTAPGVTAAPPAATAPPATAAPPVTATQQLPPVVTTTPESKEQKAEDAEEKKEAKKALSVWDKLKIRLNLF